MASKFVSIALALGLAAAAFPLVPPRALAVEAQIMREAPPEAQPMPPPEPIQPAAPAFLPDGFYYGFALEAGVAPNFATDADFEVGADWVHSFGFQAGFRVGIFRFETEPGIQSIQVGSLKLGAASPFPADDYAGNLASGSLMANLYIESPVALFGRMRPYAGWGLGFSAVHAQYTPEDCYFGVCSLEGDDIVSDSDFVKSRQFMAGLTIASDAPDLEYYLGYRRFETEDLEFRTAGNVDFVQDGLESHTFFIGVRLRR